MREEIYVEQTALRPFPAAVRRVSWGAIFAGFFVTIVLQITLTMLGIGVGAAVFKPAEQQHPAAGLGLGSGIWLLVSGLISLFIGSYVAGRLCGGPRRADGLLHGIVTWSLAELTMMLALMGATSAILNGIGSLLGTTTSTISAATGNRGNDQNTLAAAQNQIKQMFPQVGNLLAPTGRTPGEEGNAANSPGQLTALAQQDPEVASLLARLEAGGGAAKDPQDRDQLLNVLTSKHNLDQQQAANLVNQWDQQFQQSKNKTEQKARQVGQEAASGISKGAFAGFVALILGLAVSAWGGWVGTASLPQYRVVSNVTAAPPAPA